MELRMKSSHIRSRISKSSFSNPFRVPYIIHLGIQSLNSIHVESLEYNPFRLWLYEPSRNPFELLIESASNPYKMCVDSQLES